MLISVDKVYNCQQNNIVKTLQIPFIYYYFILNGIKN